jgi:hypothetical protein
MRSHCVPVAADQIRAFWVGDGVIIAAQGTLPTPCWEVEIELSPIDVWPPEFGLNRCNTGDICTQVVTPYNASEYFAFGSRPDTVIVHDEAGRHTVDVEDIPTETLLAPAEETDAAVDEAVGLSANLSFDEALRDALQKLPPWDSPIRDDMAVITVAEIGAWLGGIAGFHHLFVRVRRAKRKQT